MNCEKLKTVNLSTSLTTIGTQAFSGCMKLESINIPASVTAIPDRCFEGCSSIVTVRIPNGVMSIGQASFAKCDKITSIYLPRSLASLVRNDPTNKIDSTFSQCSSIKYIYYYGTGDMWEANDLQSAVSEITTARVYFYSETRPEGEMNPPKDKNTMADPWYWHEVGSTAVIW